jgi:lactate dehydrogenase-like 2-hydroxyacid dehydrogenase
MPGQKPVLWLSRKLSDNTEKRAARDYDTIHNPEDGTWTADEIIEMSGRVDAILACHSEIFSADVVERLSDRLKIIANHSVGYDHCNLDALRARGIIVTNTPDVLSDATAEIAFLLLLGAARRAAEGDAMVRNGEWTSWSPSFMVGTQVTGKTIGIVGMGRVGQVMAERCRGFGMTVHYHNRSRLPAELEKGAVYHDTIEDLLPHCAFVSLHCPATPDTTGIINAQRLAMLPQGAILVNTARGALVVENNLLDALKGGHIAAAGLDCFATEPGGNPAFAALKNVFMLPHIGSATRETRDAMGFRALDNLDAFFRGDEPGDRLV